MNSFDVITVLSRPVYTTTDRVVRQIYEMSNLPSGWHFGKGAPAKAIAIRGAIAIYNSMRTAGWRRFEVYPEAGGGVMVAAFGGNHCLEVLVKADSNVDVFEEQDGRDVQIIADGSVKDAIQFIQDNPCGPQSSSFYSVRSITAPQRADTIDSLFKIHLTEAEHPLLTQTALAQAGSRSAVTSPAIIQASFPETPHLSGGYQRDSSETTPEWNKRLRLRAMPATITLQT
jgi:hypothetical protein